MASKNRNRLTNWLRNQKLVFNPKISQNGVMHFQPALSFDEKHQSLKHLETTARVLNRIPQTPRESVNFFVVTLDDIGDICEKLTSESFRRRSPGFWVTSLNLIIPLPQKLLQFPVLQSLPPHD